MRTLPVAQAAPAARTGGQLVEVVVPVHNEQHVLEASIRRLRGYLSASFPFPFRITIADNASTDATCYITVDQPPASLWVMGLSARLFGAEVGGPIAAWVAETFTATSVGGATVYDLTA